MRVIKVISSDIEFGEANVTDTELFEDGGTDIPENVYAYILSQIKRFKSVRIEYLTVHDKQSTT